MSEYQRYEFMTVERPLTRAQLDAVNDLSSHIEASSAHAIIEYNWGDFKHDPIKVLHEFFDGFLYWANWGTPRLALRFPHGILSANLIDGYDFDDFVTFTQQADYDILDIYFREMEAPDEWTNYELESLIPMRDELMAGDLRALYIVWLAVQPRLEDYDDEEEKEEEDYEVDVPPVPPVPPAFGSLTAAQLALAKLLRVPQEMLVAAAQHSQSARPSTDDDFATWIKLLPPAHSYDFLLRLAHDEPGLSRLLVKELRKLGQPGTSTALPEGERVPYATLYTESEAIEIELERRLQERKQAERLSHLQDIHDHRDMYWQQVDQGAQRGTSAGYDETLRLLIELRDAASQFQTSQEFQKRFSAWIPLHLRRPALLKRLQGRKFPVPEA